MTSGLLSTGIRQLDEFLGGGLAPGSFLLVVAPPGASTEILAKQFAAGRPDANEEDDLFVTTEEPLEEVRETMARFEFPGNPKVRSLSDEYSKSMMEQERERLEFNRPESLRALIATESKDLLGGKTAPPLAFLRELLHPYVAGRAPKRLTVSTIDFFIGLYGPDPVINTLIALKMENARRGGLVFATAGKRAPDDAVEGRLAGLADCLIELEVTRRATHADHYLHIRKVKNRPVGAGVAPYRVTSHGIELDDLDRIL